MKTSAKPRSSSTMPSGVARTCIPSRHAHVSFNWSLKGRSNLGDAGYYLLHLPQGPVETATLSTGSDNDPVSRRGGSHVPAYLRTPTCDSGLRQRSPCRLHYGPADFERELNSH